MRDILKKDITIKIISVLFAIILWYSVLDKNTNPVETTSLSISLKVLNESSLSDKGIGLKVRNWPYSIKLTVKGRKDKLDSLGQNDFQAQINLSNVKSAKDNEIPVEITANKPDITIENVNPRTVKLNLDNITESSFKVDVKTTGNPNKNYKIIKTATVPAAVSVKDFDSIVKSISYARVAVNVNSLDRDLTIEQPCKFYNDKDEEITSLKNSSTVNIKIEVAKEVAVTPDIKGTPAKNCINTENKVLPDKVLITGQPEILNGISELKTEPVNIEGLSSSTDFKSRLKIPGGVKLIGTSNDITVATTIEQVGLKDFAIAKDTIEILNREADNSLNYEVQTQSITISLKGKPNILENISIDSMKPNIDVSGLTEGTYRLPLNLTLPNDVSPAENYEVEVKIDKK